MHKRSNNRNVCIGANAGQKITTDTFLGVESTRQLETCDEQLKDVLYDAAVTMNFTVLEGKRSVNRQKDLKDAGFSKTLNSKHVYPVGEPSHAVDIAPYPIKWPQKPKGIQRLLWKLVQKYVKQMSSWYFLMGYIKCISEYQGVELRFGLDWDGDMDFEDQVFDDLPHVEIKNVR